MNYYIREINESELAQRTAGIKARDDMEDILIDLSISPIDIPSKKREKASIIKKIGFHLSLYKIWKKKLEILNKGDYLYIQFPIIEHSLFLSHLFKKINKKRIYIVLIIHDLELLRVSKRDDTSFTKRMRINIEEKNILQTCSYIIAHNNKMKEYLIDLGIDGNKIVSLEIFDYLIPQYDNKEDHRNYKKDLPIIIAGNLRPHKAKYVYDLPDNYSFNLYGVGYEGETSDNIHYLGSFPSDDLPFYLEGSFGLVWDGESSNTCSGVYGEYLRINNPHKTSLYLASGLPVIIWKEAALADFVIENKCGIVVNSLYEIKDRINELTDVEYNDLLENTQKISKRLREAYYTKQAISKINNN